MRCDHSSSHVADDTRDLLGGIAVRLTTLHASGALVMEPDLGPLGLSSDATEAVRQMARWSRSLDSLRRLARDVVPAAIREPGRRFERLTELHRGSPRRTIHWPKTLARRIGRENEAEPEFVCRRATRSMGAPENTLLALTLENAIELVKQLRASGDSLGFTDYGRVLRGLDETFRSGLEAPTIRASTARPNRGPGTNPVDLETAVADRLGYPPAAPRWAHELLGIRRSRGWVPRRMSKVDLPRDDLWLISALLDAVSLVREFLPVRQRANAPSEFEHRDVRLEPLETRPGFALRRNRERTLALALPAARSWRDVRTEAAHATVFDAPRGEPIDSWLFLHRAEDSPEFETVHRGGLALDFIRLQENSEIPENALERISDLLVGEDVEAPPHTPDVATRTR